MLITKFDLYNAEWLDLVFDHRNKNYGAYELRSTYSKTLTKAMGIAFAAVAVLSAATIVFKAKPKKEYVFHEVSLKNPVDIPKPPVEAKPKQPDPPAAAQQQQKPAVQVETKVFTNPHLVTTDPPTDPPTINDLKDVAIGSEDVKGPVGDGNVLKTETGTPGGPGTAKVDDGVHTIDGLEVMPEPVGGAAAWAKFLQKNLRFPAVAQEQGVSGRVFMSFIIEKDGTLSNIKVDRGAGYGFDEEATRVLKLAKAWKPGVQNGQNVRVRYSIPISFQLATEE